MEYLELFAVGQLPAAGSALVVDSAATEFAGYASAAAHVEELAELGFAEELSEIDSAARFVSNLACRRPSLR